MTRIKCYFLILAFILPILTHDSVYVANDVPHIYYYSENQSTFIIESAGSISQNVVTNSVLQNDIMGLSWSSTGNWYSWLDSDVNAQQNLRIHFFNPMEDRKFHIPLNMMGEIYYSAWSPQNEYLLVVLRVNMNQTNFYIFDPLHEVIMNELSFDDINIWKVEWSSVEQVIVYYTQPYTVELWENHPPGVKTIHLDENFEIADTNIFLFDCEISFRGDWIENIWMYMPEKDVLTIEDSVSKKSQQYTLPEQIIENIVWNENLTSALIYTKNDCYSRERDIWLLSTVNDSIELIKRDIKSGHWIPSTNKFIVDSDKKLFLYENTLSIKEHQIDFSTVESLSILETSMSLSSDGTYFVFTAVNQDFESITFLYNVVDKLLQPLPIDHTQTYFSTAEISPNTQYIMFSGQCEVGVFICIFDLDSNQLVSVDSASSLAYKFLWHPTSNWVIVVEEGFISGTINVINIDNLTQHELTTCRSCFGWLPIYLAD